MDLKTIDKISLLFDGLISRMRENNELFKGIDIILKSGSKEYKGAIGLDNGNPCFMINKDKEVLTYENIGERLMSECKKYDAVTIKYRERGYGILLESREGKVKTKPLPKEDLTKEDENPLLKDKEYILKPSEARELLIFMGLMTKDGKLKNDKIRKFNQINRFLELTREVFEGIDKQRITVLDCGCGKSYLTFAVNYYLTEVLHKKCHTIGVDISEGVIKHSSKIAKNLGYENMSFVCADLRQYEPSQEIDVVISLHACDTATDLALAAAIRYCAKGIICVPCCHKELKDELKINGLEKVLSYGLFRARMNDVITDALRAAKLEASGYDVRVIEYISPLDTPKNIMITGVKGKSPNNAAKEEYEKLIKAVGAEPNYLKGI